MKKTVDATDKTYLDITSEKTAESKPNAQPSAVPEKGTVLYELRGIGWNMKGILHGLEELNHSAYETNRLLEQLINEIKEFKLRG